jgi:hypothetical protein
MLLSLEAATNAWSKQRVAEWLFTCHTPPSHVSPAALCMIQGWGRPGFLDAIKLFHNDNNKEYNNNNTLSIVSI